MPASQRWTWLAAAWVLAVLWLEMACFHAGPIDDAYIFCRYALNLVSGAGAVFNAGERVEGYSSPAFLALVTLVTALGGRGVAAAWLPSVLFGCLTPLSLLVLLPRAERSAAVAAALLCVAPFQWAAWSSSGMDATLFAFVVAVAVLCFERMRGNARRWLLGLTALVRPEGLAVVAALIALEMPRPRRERLSEKLAPLAAIVPFALLTIARRAYYGAWLPNTFYAKVDVGSAPVIARGLGYLALGALALLPLVVAASGGAVQARRSGRSLVLPAAVVALWLGAVAEGGDYFPWQRFLVPTVPLLAVLAARALMKARRHWLGVAVVAVLTFAVSWAAPGRSTKTGQYAIGGARDAYQTEASTAELWEEVGTALAERFPGSHSIALVPVGAIALRTGWRVVDMVGLTDLHIARMKGMVGLGTAAHEKFDAEYVLDHRPEFIFLHHNVVFRAPEPPEGLASALALDADADMARSSRFQREYEPYWLQLGPERYVVLFRRIAPA